MRKLAIAVAVALSCAFGLHADGEATARKIFNGSMFTMSVNVFSFQYSGHEYIILSGGYGVCIVHSESCRCKAKPGQASQQSGNMR